VVLISDWFYQNFEKMCHQTSKWNWIIYPTSVEIELFCIHHCFWGSKKI